MNQTCRILLEKSGQVHKWCTPIDPFTWPSKSRATSTVRIWCVALRICWKRWTIGRGGEKGSGISVLMARHHDDGLGLFCLEVRELHLCLYIHFCWIASKEVFFFFFFFFCTQSDHAFIHFKYLFDLEIRL